MPQAEYISTFNGKKIYAERAEKTKTYGYDIDSRLASLRRVGPLIAGDGVNLEDGASGVRISAYGPTGVTGPRGGTGNTGATGPCGPKGPCGPLGFCGPKGACGPLGYCGPKGACGPLGYCGPSGAKGACGPQGYCGPIGATGAKGACGPLGYCGPKGGSGLTGFCGPLGFCGPKGGSGPTGFCGPLGFCGPSGVPGSKGIPGACGPLGYCGPKGWLGSVTWPTSAWNNCDTATHKPTSTAKKVDSWDSNSGRAALVEYNFYTTTSSAMVIDVTFKNVTDNKSFVLTVQIKSSSPPREFHDYLFVQPGKAYEVYVTYKGGTANTLQLKKRYLLLNNT